MPATAPERAKTSIRCQLRLIPRPAAPVSLPRMADRYRPTVPLRTSRTPIVHTTRTAIDRTNSGWPVGSKKLIGPSQLRWRRRPPVPCSPPSGRRRRCRIRALRPGSSVPVRAPSVVAMPRASTTATAAATTAPTTPPTRKLSPRWLASCPAVKAPTPARVAWARESWPPMPVMRVMERKMVEKASPALKTFSQVLGIHVSIETTKAASSTHQSSPDDPVELRRPGRRGGRRGRRVHRRQRIPRLVEGAQPGHEEQRADQDDERQRRQHRRVPDAVGCQVALGSEADDADRRPRPGRRCGMDRSDAPRGGGDGRHHQGDVVLRLQVVFDRRRGEQDPGQSGHQPRDRPGGGHHPAGVDPVELDQAAALDGAAHLQPEAGEPHENHQRGEHDDGEDRPC